MAKRTKIVDGKKNCRDCGTLLPLDSFHRQEGGLGDRASQCSVCRSISMRKYRREHPQQVKTSHRRSRLMRTYNITLAEYDQMFEQQNGVCIICGLPEITCRLNIDHDHKTGKIRGLLCVSCNMALGFIENKEKLKRMLEYLGE